MIFVFDGSMDEIPNGEEETLFYRDCVQMVLQTYILLSNSYCKTVKLKTVFLKIVFIRRERKGITTRKSCLPDLIM